MTVSVQKDLLVGGRRTLASVGLILAALVSIAVGVLVNLLPLPGWLKVAAGALAVLVPLALLGPRLPPPPPAD